MEQIRAKVAEFVEYLSEALQRLANRLDQPSGGHRRDHERRAERRQPHVVPYAEATPLGLALDPQATIQLSEEQTEIALAIERAAASARREAAHTG